MRTVLVTGATGAIGAPLVRLLLKRGYHVLVLARNAAKASGYLNRFCGQSVTIIEGEITQVGGGMKREIALSYAGQIDAFIHVAGATQYHESLREETYRVNRLGTLNALELAALLEIDRFAFISTCYVAGRRCYLGEDEIGAIEESNNPYESSKIEAEALVRNFPGESVIIRLSTVIGEEKSGFIVNAGGYAAFVRGFWASRSRFKPYPNNPFWVPVNPESTLNLVTNDWVVDMIEKTIRSATVGTVHLSHTHPVRMGRLFDKSVATLGLPLTYSREVAERTALWHDPTWRKLQANITEGIVGYFGPYVTRDTTFGHERVMQIPEYIPPPPITDEVIKAQVSYMTDHLFTRRRLEAVAA